MTFEKHEVIRRVLVQALTEEPADNNTCTPSAEQVRCADKLMWRLLRKSAKKGLRGHSSAGKLPLDDLVDTVVKSYDVALMLRGVACGDVEGKRKGRSESSNDLAGGPHHTKRQKTSEDEKCAKGEISALKQQVNVLTMTVKGLSEGHAKGGKGKGKNKSSGRAPPEGPLA